MNEFEAGIDKLRYLMIFSITLFFVTVVWFIEWVFFPNPAVAMACFCVMFRTSLNILIYWRSGRWRKKIEKTHGGLGQITTVCFIVDTFALILLYFSGRTLTFGKIAWGLAITTTVWVFLTLSVRRIVAASFRLNATFAPFVENFAGDEETRQYYQETWGFDPVTDRVPGSQFSDEAFRYETYFPLARDPILHPHIEIGARLVVLVEGANITRIVFRKGNREEMVECVHTAVYGKKVPNEKEMEELAESSEWKQVNLSPEEHFAALKSYVAGMAEFGIGRMFELAYLNQDDPLHRTIGFNDMMQSQVLKALQRLDKKRWANLVGDFLVGLADRDPAWFQEKIEDLNRTFSIGRVAQCNQEFCDQIWPLADVRGNKYLYRHSIHSCPECQGFPEQVVIRQTEIANIALRYKGYEIECVLVCGNGHEWSLGVNLFASPFKPNLHRELGAALPRRQRELWLDVQGVLSDHESEE